MKCLEYGYEKEKCTVITEKKSSYQRSSYILNMHTCTHCAGIHKLIAYHTVLFILPKPEQKRNSGWMNFSEKKKTGLYYHRIMCLQSPILFNRIVLHSYPIHFGFCATHTHTHIFGHFNSDKITCDIWSIAFKQWHSFTLHYHWLTQNAPHHLLSWYFFFF